MRAAWLCAAALAAAAGAALAQSPPAGNARLARGEILVRENCGGCHAVGRSDASAMRGAPPLRDLHRRYEPEMLGEALAEGILTGHPAMPPFSFPPAEVDAIILYLDSIQARQKG